MSRLGGNVTGLPIATYSRKIAHYILFLIYWWPLNCRAAGAERPSEMVHRATGYDPIGVVVDWIDACKQRQLDSLLNLYDSCGSVECCEGGSFHGRSEIEKYWRPRLARAPPNAFEIEAIMTQPNGVTLEYRGYDSQPVRTHFRFTDAGKISLTASEPIKAVL